MSGYTRMRSTVGTLRQRGVVGRWLILTVLVVSLTAATVLLPVATAEPGTDLTVTNVTPADSGVSAGETLPVDIEVNNTDTTNSTTQTLSLAVDTDYDPDSPNFTVINETTVSLNASETTTRSLSYDTEVGDGEEIELRATTDDDSNGTTTTATISDDPPADPGTYRGTITASDGIDAPVGTTLTASVDGEPQDTITVETRGEYGDTAFNDSLVVAADADEADVNFTVEGIEATNSPVRHEATDNVVNLTFPDRTFRAPIAVSINDSASELSVTESESISVAVDLENTLTDTTLTENISASIAGSTQASQSVTIEPGETDSITLTFPADPAFDNETLTVTSEKGSDTRELAVSLDPIDVETVEDFETTHEFIGVVRDPDDLGVTASVRANETPITGDVTVRILRDGTVLYDAGKTAVTNGSVSTTVDPTGVPISTAPGQATVELGGEPAGTIELYHEVQTFSEGTHPLSVPQPAQLHVDGSFRATQWDAETGSYSSATLDPTGDFSDPSELHESIYLLADEPLRVGFEFESDGGLTVPSDETIHPGWNFIGSNYDISSNDFLSLNDDLLIGSSEVDAYSPTGEPLAGSDPVYPYDAYWVYADSTVDRGILTQGYNATARGR